MDEFTLPAAGENLVNFRGFMTDFNRHSTGILIGEYHHVINYFTGWVDEFTMLAAGENLVNFRGFMTCLNRHSTGI